jgi:hypothetical protein
MPEPMDGCCHPDGFVSAEAVDCVSMCDDYCSAAISACTGDLAFFTDVDNSGNSKDECLEACRAFTFKVGTADETNSNANTLGCRIYHLSLAAGDPDVHCPHARPDGGGVCSVEFN